MSRLLRGVSAFAIVSLVFLVLFPGIALAHETRTVGPFTFEVGWGTEPAYAEQENGISLAIKDKASGKPVTGAEKTLKVEILQGSARMSLPLTPVESAPGQYQAFVVPTMPGDYQFHFTGNINGTTIDETFKSGPATFDNVETIDSIQFPKQLPSLRELDGVTRAAQQASIDARDTAHSTRNLAIAGIAVGGVGVVLSGVALFMAFSRRW